MAPKKFNKNNSQTFSLVYRAQNDPRIHDPEASDMVFTEKPLSKNKIKSRDDLDSEFGDDIRENEGEAANHGIYYDDSEYDYMQHMRDLGSSDAYFIEAAPVKGKKGKAVKLEDALRSLDLQNDGASIASSQYSTASSIFHDDMLPSEFVKRYNYQDMQDTPDAIGGFQPDMDPRLREVLEALDDDAYVDDDENIFEALQGDAEEVDPRDFELSHFDDIVEGDEEDGWESDRTVKAEDNVANSTSSPSSTTRSANNKKHPSQPQSDRLEDDADLPDHGDGAWLAEFAKSKRDAAAAKPRATATTPAQKRLEMQSSVITGASSLASGRKKKRKGAMTSSSGYSMSSSVLARTEGQSILDRRFDKIEEEYGDDDDEDARFADADDTSSLASGMSRMSGVSRMSGWSNMSGLSKAGSQGPQVLRSDFGDIMDEFLGNYSKVGNRGRHVRKGKPATGMEQLDDIRKELGAPRIGGSRGKSLQKT